jgi:hypothetical protein
VIEREDGLRYRIRRASRFPRLCRTAELNAAPHLPRRRRAATRLLHVARTLGVCANVARLAACLRCAEVLGTGERANRALRGCVRE